MYQKSIIHYIAKTLIDILFYAGIVATLAVPFLSSRLYAYIGYRSNLWQMPFMLVLLTSGACCVFMLFHLKQMYRTLLVGNPFIPDNVKRLRMIAVACLLIALIYIAKCFFLFTFGTVIISLVFIIGCLFCLTLKDLFKQAVNYKAENDLTI